MDLDEPLNELLEDEHLKYFVFLDLLRSLAMALFSRNEDELVRELVEKEGISEELAKRLLKLAKSTRTFISLKRKAALYKLLYSFIAVILGVAFLMLSRKVVKNGF